MVNKDWFRSGTTNAIARRPSTKFCSGLEQLFNGGTCRMARLTISELAKICIADLQKENNVYLYGQALVKPSYSEATGMRSLEPITQGYVRYFLREKSPDLPENFVRIVAEHVFAKPELPFPRVKAIVNVPFFRP